jgi:HD superfamily phosphodiesterase
MNAADEKPNYKKAYQFVKQKFEKTTHFKHGPFDETFYTLRVYESAKEIMKKLNRKVKIQQVLMAAILHDIGKVKMKPSRLFKRNEYQKTVYEEWKTHAKLSVPIAKKYLQKQGHSKEFISEVLYLIENHALRGNMMKNRTIELEILQDADLIADIGFAGFIRPFLFSGKFNKRGVISSIEYIQKEDRTDNGKEINLKISKVIARNKIKIQKELAKEIGKDIISDLL